MMNKKVSTDMENGNLHKISIKTKSNMNKRTNTTLIVAHMSFWVSFQFSFWIKVMMFGYRTL